MYDAKSESWVGVVLKWRWDLAIEDLDPIVFSALKSHQYPL